MLKRKVEGGGGEGPSKKAQTGEDAPEPIPRHLPLQHVDLFFTQRSWEEIAPGELYYLPTCQNPYYMFDATMQQRWDKFRGLWETMEISKPTVRITNPIMLQDDLRVQSNTPTDATAFTQVVYMIKWCPQSQREYYKLQSLNNEINLEGNDLTYDLADGSLNKRLIKMKGNYQGFDQLLIKPSRRGELAPWNLTKGKPSFDSKKNLTNDYISPNNEGGSPSQNAFGSRTAAVSYIADDGKFVKNKDILTLAKNTDGISFYKYGDMIEFTIETNLDGKKLKNYAVNDFSKDMDIITGTGPLERNHYRTEWIYPGRYRPYYSRRYLETDIGAVLNATDLKPLTHCFFTMPPIKKPNGALLGQRTSFIMEQNFHIRLNFGQTACGDLDSSSTNFLYQDDAITLRRNVYPKPYQVERVSPFCKYGLKRKTTTIALPFPDTAIGMAQWLDGLTKAQMNRFITIARAPTECDDTSNLWKELNDEILVPQSWVEYGKEWRTLINDDAKFICVKWKNVAQDPIIPRQWVYFYNNQGATIFQGDIDDPPKYMKIDITKMRELLFELYPNLSCNTEPQLAAPVIDTTSNVFYA